MKEIDVSHDPNPENIKRYWDERQAKLQKPELKEMEIDPRIRDITDFFSLHVAILEYYEKRPMMKEFNQTGLNAEAGLVKEASEVLDAAQLFPENIESELADVYIYLTTVADKHNINLFSAVVNKLLHNDDRFPEHTMQGSGDDFPTKYKEIKIARQERTIYERK